MAFFERTQRDIVSNALERLTRTTNITQLAPGSKTRFLLDAVAEEQANQHNIFDTNLMQAFIKYADSKFLDFFGDMMNLPRREPSHAEAADENFMFYVSTGTFGDINGTGDIIIPAGTTVQTVPYEGTVITPGIENQAVINYVTTEQVTAQASQQFVYAPVRAVLEGKNSDVPRNVLNKHDFSTYVLAANEVLKCTNRYAISNGEDRETDDSYRFRLAEVFEAKNLAIYAAIRLAALSVPGVADIKPVLAEQGPGTYSLYIRSLTPTTSPRLLSEVAAACQSVTSFGVRPFILAPSPIGLEFVAAVSWNPKATSAQIAEGYRDMRNALENYLNNTNIGETVFFSDLIDILLQSTPYAFSIGASNANKFEEVYAYRNNPLNDSIVRNIVIGDRLEPIYNERVILETSGRNRGIQFMTRSSG
jgi:uncharacterized phage protein gp47/JayE